MLSPLLSPTIQHGLNPLSAIREYTWESSLLEISPSVPLTCLVHPRATALLAEQTGFIFDPAANNLDAIPYGVGGERESGLGHGATADERLESPWPGCLLSPMLGRSC